MKKKFLCSFVLASALLCSCSQMVEVTNPDSSQQVTLQMSVSEMNISVGQSAKLEVYVDGEVGDITWRVSDTNVLTISGVGTSATIVGQKRGTANVIARTNNGGVAFCKVNVGGGSSSAAVVNSISLNYQTLTMAPGDTKTLVATINGSGYSTAYNSSAPSVVKVTAESNTTAKLEALSVGSATITVIAGDKSKTCEISVEEIQNDFYIKLSSNYLSMKVNGADEVLTAEYKPSTATVTWLSNNPDVASVDDNGRVSPKATGSAVISATIENEAGEKKTATCNVLVAAEGGESDYESRIASWSKSGHLYLHYLRESDTDYSKWALWIWQNYPNDLEGSLWGADHVYEADFKGVTAETFGKMTNAECGGTGNDVYVDEYGVVIDVDLTKEDLLCGKSRTPAPLVTSWENISRNMLGFLIVDQTKMDGSDNWVSDGGAETYIRRLGSLMPDGKDSYLHVYCVEGNVANYTTASGKQVFVNPTVNDTTGKYRSQNDITNLKEDKYKNGVATSTTFLEDRPGIGYQIFVPSFADSDGDGFGDIKGITEKLDYLEDLGVEVLWLTPIQESNSYHGYDVTDYYKIDSKFGTLEDYQELIYKAHKKGMKVLMDMVINHTSKSNVLYKKSQVAATGKDPYGNDVNFRDMYLWKYEGDKVLEWDGTLATANNPYGPDNPAKYMSVNVENNADWYKDGTSNYYYYGKFGSGMAELNYSSQATRDYMINMCKYWLSFGLDGFRLDAIKHIYLLGELDPSYNTAGDYITYDVSMRSYYDEEKLRYVEAKNDYTYDRDLNVMFWKQFSGALKSAYPNCFLVGENFDGWNQRIAPFYEAIDSQFDFSTYYHLHESTMYESGITAMGGDIQATLNYNKTYRKDHINGAFTSNHDVARFINHCASSDATAHHAEVNDSNKSLALKKARWDAAITLLTPGVSWIYYGDEIGLSGNVNDKVPDSLGNIYDDHGNNVDRWYRQPMRWGKTKGEDMVVNYTFGGVEVLWDYYNQKLATVPEQMNDSNSLYTLFKALCHVKNDDRYPTYGYVVNQWGDGSYLCLQISDGTRTVNAFINSSDSPRSIEAMNSGEFIGGSVGASATNIPANGFSVVKK